MTGRKRVVVIGHGATSRLGVIRAVSELDCEVYVIALQWYGRWGKKVDTTKPFDCYSKYIRRVFYCFAQDRNGLVRILLDKCADPDQKVVLIPDSDFAAAVIDENIGLLKEHFLFPHINNIPGSVLRWMDKSVQKELAGEIGLNYAQSQIISISKGQYSIPEGVRYPCFTKALVSTSGGKQLFQRCDTRESLVRFLDTVANEYETRILIEDYIEIEKEYAVVGFSDGDGVIIPGVIQFSANSRSHFGVARMGTVRPVPQEMASAIELFKEYVRKIGYTGIFDIDFFYSKGRFIFDELNLRYGGSGYAITKSGVNLPAMLVKYLCQEDVDGMNQSIGSPATFVNENLCLDDWYQGYLTLKQVRSDMRSSDILFVKDKVDRAPYRALFRRFCVLGIKKIIKGILHR